MIDFIDTHCHLHELTEDLSPTHARWLADRKPRTAEEVIERAKKSQVSRMICIGTTAADSKLAVRFASSRRDVWATIGIHPHEAKHHIDQTVLSDFSQLVSSAKVVGIGETGLDYYYGLSPKEDQEKILRFQIELAIEHNLPVSFHVRDAFDDFWPIFDSYNGVKGVLHSFTDSRVNADKALERGLIIGINGIATFTKDKNQLELYRSLPEESIVLETDAPYLTPAPFRGTMCEPEHVRATAEFVANLRGVSLSEIAKTTTVNATKLFKI